MPRQPVDTAARRVKQMLRRRSCAFCSTRLTTPAAGRCGSMWRPEGFTDDQCGWVRAIRKLGAEEAIRQSKLPAGQRSKV